MISGIAGGGYWFQAQVAAAAEDRSEAAELLAKQEQQNVAKEAAATVEELVALARHPKMVGIGETGLDYHYTSESAAAQQASLRVHIEAARRTALPLIIHRKRAIGGPE